MNTTLRTGGAVQRALLATAIGVVVGAGALVWTRTELLSLQYRLARQVDAEAELRAEVEKLRVEVAALSAPGRIEREARALGLRVAGPDQVVNVAADVAAGDAPAGGTPR